MCLCVCVCVCVCVCLWCSAGVVRSTCKLQSVDKQRCGIERRDPRPVHVDDGAEAAGCAADNEWCVVAGWCSVNIGFGLGRLHTGNFGAYVCPLDTYCPGNSTAPAGSCCAWPDQIKCVVSVVLTAQRVWRRPAPTVPPTAPAQQAQVSLRSVARSRACVCVCVREFA